MTWQGPRIAYLLAATWARAAGNRGAGGPLSRVTATWNDLRPGDQADVLTALDGHARAARALLATRGLLGRLNVDALIEAAGAGQLCQQARQGLWLRLADEPVAVPMPGCGHCAAITVAAMLDVAFRAYVLAGFTPEMIAGHCDAAAGRPVPELRLVAQEAS